MYWQCESYIVLPEYSLTDWLSVVIRHDIRCRMICPHTQAGRADERFPYVPVFRLGAGWSAVHLRCKVKALFSPNPNFSVRCPCLSVESLLMSDKSPLQNGQKAVILQCQRGRKNPILPHYITMRLMKTGINSYIIKVYPESYEWQDVHKNIASYVFCCKQLKLQQCDTCHVNMGQNPPKSDFSDSIGTDWAITRIAKQTKDNEKR